MANNQANQNETLAEIPIPTKVQGPFLSQLPTRQFSTTTQSHPFQYLDKCVNFIIMFE